MSLAVLANTMASKGRNGDSMLVHMSPDEVRALQALAERHGKTLTINPETGQPEAFSLKSLLPMIAGMALNYFVPGLGSAVGGAFGVGAAAGTGIAVGGITALATGDISRGLMAGLGAYGGAGLGESLMGAGTEALASEATKAAAIPAEQAGDWMAQEAANRSVDAQLASKTAGDRLSAGFGAATESPTAAANFAKANWKPLAAAAAPIMAGAMVPTTTGMPRPMDTGYIRQKKFNPYTQQYIDLEPVKASEWGSRRFSDYAGGGIVALAEGGQSNFAIGDHPNVKEFMDATGSDFQTAAEMIYGVVGSNTDTRDWNAIMSAEDPVAAARSATNEMYGGVWIGNYTDPATNTTAPMLFSASGVPLTSGISRAADFGYVAAPTAASAATTALPTAPMAAAGSPARAGVDAFQIGAGQDAAASKYLSDNPDVAAWLASSEGKAWAAQNPSYDPSDIAWTHYVRYGANEGREWGAPVQTATTLPGTGGGVPGGGVPGGGVPGGTTNTYTGGFSTTPQTYAPPGTTNPYGNYINPGDLTFNPDSSVTVTPNVSGRPYGGFTGMGQVRDAYTAGGGSLGQDNLFVPKTIEEMYARYGNTGGSQQAYDYLMNKGAASIKKPVAPGGQLMLPYAQSVLGQEIPAITSGPSTQKYIFDWKNRRYIPNPNYVDPNAPKKETAKTETAQTEQPVQSGRFASGGYALGGLGALAAGGQAGYNLGSYSDGGRLLRGPGDGVSDSIPATIGDKQPARLADGEFVVPARIVSELGNGSTEAGARKLYAMMDRVQRARGKTTGKGKVAKDTSADKYLPA